MESVLQIAYRRLFGLLFPVFRFDPPGKAAAANIPAKAEPIYQKQAATLLRVGSDAVSPTPQKSSIVIRRLTLPRASQRSPLDWA